MELEAPGGLRMPVCDRVSNSLSMSFQSLTATRHVFQIMKLVVSVSEIRISVSDNEISVF